MTHGMARGSMQSLQHWYCRPVEWSDYIFRTANQALDAHEQMVDAYRDALEAHHLFVKAWSTAVINEPAGEQQQNFDQPTNTERTNQRPASETTEFTLGERLHAIERRQDALERKIDEILDIVKE